MADKSAFDVVKQPIDAANISGGVYSCLPIPLGLVPVICGALEPFIYPDAYSGKLPETVAAARLVETFVATVATLEKCDQVVPACPECGGAGGIVILEDEMGGVVTEVTVEDGVLYVWYGGCCVKSFAIDALPQAPINQPGEVGEFVLPPSVPAWSSSACVKATKIVDVHLNIVDSLLDSAAASRTPWEMMASLKSDVPGIVFGTADVLTAYGYAVGVDFAGLASEAEAPDLYQTMRCRIAALISDDEAGLTADEYSQVKSTVHSVASDAFPFLLYPVNQPGLVGLHKHAIMAIGKNDARTITSYLNATGSEDCSCPGAEGQVPDVTWAAHTSVTVVIGTYETVRRFNNGLSIQHEYVTDGSAFCKLDIDTAFDLAGSTLVDEMTIAFEPVLPSDELLHYDWHEPAAGGCPDLTHAGTGQFSSGTGRVEETQVSGGMVYKRVTYVTQQGALAWGSGEIRACERNVNLKTYNWNMHIVSVNDVATGVKPQIGGWTN